MVRLESLRPCSFPPSTLLSALTLAGLDLSYHDRKACEGNFIALRYITERYIQSGSGNFSTRLKLFPQMCGSSSFKQGCRKFYRNQNADRHRCNSRIVRWHGLGAADRAGRPHASIATAGARLERPVADIRTGRIVRLWTMPRLSRSSRAHARRRISAWKLRRR